MIKFYNSLTKKKEEFISIKKSEVKIYSCGPTVYDFVHIGNLRAALFADILIRTLKYFNYKVISVMNITDIDDKIINKSKNEIKINNEKLTPNKIIEKFTKEYTNYFLEDLNTINIEKPQIMPKATESIKDIEFLIKKLISKKYAYIANDGIYFDIKKDKNYGKLVKIDFLSQKYNKENRVIEDEYDKDNSQDFALWKFKKEKNEPSWKINIENKIFEGRPGWHIECSAMSLKHLGEKFDIHTGGIDLKFPHHENEICQSSCALDINSQANFWMHNEHLLVDNKKMSKSLGNYHTLRSLIKKGYSPLAIREVFLRANYRQQLNFTFESLDTSEKNIKKINDFYQKLNEIKPKNENINTEILELKNKYLNKFELAMKDDLNTPIAISTIYEFMNKINKINNLSEKDIEYIKEFMEKTNKIFNLLEIKKTIPKDIISLANQRLEAKKNKNWDLADTIRDKIQNLGFEIKDDKNSKEGYIISKI